MLTHKNKIIIKVYGTSTTCDHVVLNANGKLKLLLQSSILVTGTTIDSLKVRREKFRR